MKYSTNAISFDGSGYLFIKSRINTNTGLIGDSEDEPLTTVYKNVLAAIALIHEEDVADAERIFKRFNKYYLLNKEDFHGFPQTWNIETGLPDTTSIHWEGDSAFLLLALNYYNQANGNFGDYELLVQGLIKWLSQRVNLCDLIVAEGVAIIYASLLPFSKNNNIQTSLTKLRCCFFSTAKISSKDYEHNLKHIVLGALVFEDTTGFNHLKSYIRTEMQDHGNQFQITAFSAFAGDSIINVEISVQVLLALKLWHIENHLNTLNLQTGLEKLLLPEKRDFSVSGVSNSMKNHRDKIFYALPAVEPTCYLLFYYWGFNPFQITDLRF